MKRLFLISAFLISLPAFAGSISCEFNIGGNFFRPKTNVLCDIDGAGAIRYEIKVNGSTKWRGDLDPYSSTQSFITNKKKVGGHFSKYEIFLISENGDKVLVYLKTREVEEEYFFDFSGLYASCEFNIGGNFFNPKTKVLCDIDGTGAIRYEIKVNGSTKWRGRLDPYSSFQSFITPKKKVGGYAVDYHVYLIDQDGNKRLVAEQLRN